MAEYSASFSVAQYHKNISLEEQFAWWQELGSYIMPACDHFQLDCHMNDIEGLRSCARLGASKTAERISGGSIEVWRGSIDRNFAAEFLLEPFDYENNRIKWHNVFLRCGQYVVMAITENGGEVGLHKLDDDDIEFLQELASEYDLTLYYWNNAPGDLVPFLEFVYKEKEE